MGSEELALVGEEEEEWSALGCLAATDEILKRISLERYRWHLWHVVICGGPHGQNQKKESHSGKRTRLTKLEFQNGVFLLEIFDSSERKYF